VEILSRPWRKSLVLKLPFEAKAPSKKERVDLMLLTLATRKRIFTV
jgi:hypothetical protein